MGRAADWSQIAERGSVLGLRALLACYRLFGRPLSLVLVHVIVLYYFLVLGRARRASRAYLERIASRPAGREAMGRKAGLVASFLHFRAFALSIFDRITIWFGGDDGLRFQVVGGECYDRMLAPDRGGIVVGSHLGSFDALRALSHRDERVVSVVMFTRHAPRITAFFQELSPSSRLRVIQAEADPVEAVLQIRACVSRGELVAILGDRVEPGNRNRTREVPFLGSRVAFPTAPYLLADLLDCPLYFMVALRDRRGLYRVFAELIAEKADLGRKSRDENLEKLVATYAGRLEHYCDVAPYEWFNFFDFWGEQV
jgi:predicted LPLAT superfamily acyltransferase